MKYLIVYRKSEMIEGKSTESYKAVFYDDADSIHTKGSVDGNVENGYEIVFSDWVHCTIEL